MDLGVLGEEGRQRLAVAPVVVADELVIDRADRLLIRGWGPRVRRPTCRLRRATRGPIPPSMIGMAPSQAAAARGTTTLSAVRDTMMMPLVSGSGIGAGATAMPVDPRSPSTPSGAGIAGRTIGHDRGRGGRDPVAASAGRERPSCSIIGCHRVRPRSSGGPPWPTTHLPSGAISIIIFRRCRSVSQAAGPLPEDWPLLGHRRPRSAIGPSGFPENQPDRIRHTVCGLESVTREKDPGPGTRSVDGTARPGRSDARLPRAGRRAGPGGAPGGHDARFSLCGVTTMAMSRLTKAR